MLGPMWKTLCIKRLKQPVLRPLPRLIIGGLWGGALLSRDLGHLQPLSAHLGFALASETQGWTILEDASAP